MGSALVERSRRFYPDEDAWTHGKPVAGGRNPAWADGDSPRFIVYVDSHDPDDEPDWRYKLRVIDLKYLGDEVAPIDAVAHGDSWAGAFECAGEYIREALASATNIFY